MDIHRKQWNDQQAALQRALAKPKDHPEWPALFLRHHAMLHASAITGTGDHSFDDEVWQDLPLEAARRIPTGGEHSIAWMIWHIARIEDVTMNLLIGGRPQVFVEGDWQARLNAPTVEVGNAFTLQEITDLSNALDIAALRDYRSAVGCRTREIIPALPPERLKAPVEAARIEQVLAQSAVVEADHWLVEYWGSRTIAGLILMPATRHLMVHLNEAVKIKKKVLKAGG